MHRNGCAFEQSRHAPAEHAPSLLLPSRGSFAQRIGEHVAADEKGLPRQDDLRHNLLAVLAVELRAYEHTTTVPDRGLFNATGRGFPDLAAQATDFLVVSNFIPEPVDGTSCASPTAAARSVAAPGGSDSSHVRTAALSSATKPTAQSASCPPLRCSSRLLSPAFVSLSCCFAGSAAFFVTAAIVLSESAFLASTIEQLNGLFDRALHNWRVGPRCEALRALRTDLSAGRLLARAVDEAGQILASPLGSAGWRGDLLTASEGLTAANLFVAA